MARILICDDEQGLRTVIKRYAQFEGHETTEAKDGREAVEACRRQTFDMAIIDGFSVFREIRKVSDVPVLMLTTEGEGYDKEQGFEAGVEDCVAKPFSSREIMQRIGAMLRRAGQDATIGEDGHVIYVKDGLKVDMTAYKLFVDGEQVALAPKVYDLLFFLVRNKNVMVPRDRILTDVWGYRYHGDDRTLDTHMKHLRKALGPYAGLVTTLRGLGYRFEG